MSIQEVWRFLHETEVFDVSLASLLGKVLLVSIVWAIAWTLEHALVRVTRKVLVKAKVPSASILINMLRGVIWSLALMMVLEPVFGIQPTAFVAALGVGSVALSLGLQDTVSNIIGGISLMTGKVIEPGDVVRIGDFTGVVTDLTWRSTFVSDPYGQVDVIPNSVLWKQALVKLSDFTVGRCVLQLFVRHGSDLEEVRADVDRIATEVLDDWYDAEQGTQVIVVSMDPGGIITQLVVHVHRGVLVDTARTKLAQGVAGRPWLKVA